MARTPVPSKLKMIGASLSSTWARPSGKHSSPPGFRPRLIDVHAATNGQETRANRYETTRPDPCLLAHLLQQLLPLLVAAPRLLPLLQATSTMFATSLPMTPSGPSTTPKP